MGVQGKRADGEGTAAVDEGEDSVVSGFLIIISGAYIPEVFLTTCQKRLRLEPLLSATSHCTCTSF